MQIFTKIFGDLPNKIFTLFFSATLRTTFLHFLAKVAEEKFSSSKKMKTEAREEKNDSVKIFTTPPDD